MEKKLTRVQPFMSQSPTTTGKSSSTSNTTNFAHSLLQDSGKGKLKGKYGNHGDRDGVSNRNKSNGTNRTGNGHQRRSQINQQNNEVNKRCSEGGKKLHSNRVNKPVGDKASRHGENASHLLNFTYAPLRSQEGGSNPRMQYRGGRSRRQPVHTKEQFLLAHCQFLVKAPQTAMDYMENLTDSDKMVDWENIEQVILKDDQMPSCPICMDIPAAAKITKCAHIYCWPCILHCLSLSDKRWAKCPICFDSIERQDLKSVMIQATTKYKVGDEVTFQLMKREREALYARPKASWIPASGNKLFTSYEGTDDDVMFSKLLSATAHDIERIVVREREQLLKRLQRDDTESLEASFIQAALDQLTAHPNEMGLNKKQIHQLSHSDEEAQASCSQIRVPEVNSVKSDPNMKSVCYADAFDEFTLDEFESVEQVSIADERPTDDASADGSVAAAFLPSPVVSGPAHTIAENAMEAGVITNTRLRCVSSTSSCDSGEAEKLAADLVLPATGTQPGHSSGSKRTEVYYFYQAKDGQQVFLHSINTRILAAQYKSLEMAPQTITATIVECEENSMTPELRKRLKYLGHLPLYTQFIVCEVTLRPPMVSSNCLANFYEELNNRKRLRNRRLRAETKQYHRAQAEDRRRMGQYPDMRLALNSDRHFPESASIAPYMPPTVAANQSEIFGATVNESDAASTTIISPHAAPGRHHHVPITTPYSFAQAMATGFGPSAPVWPKKSSNYVRPNGPQKERSSREGQLPVGAIGTEEVEECNAPSFQQSFSAGFEELDLSVTAVSSCNANIDEGDEDSAAGQKTKEKKKKKKKKQLVLFSTSGQEPAKS